MAIFASELNDLLGRQRTADGGHQRGSQREHKNRGTFHGSANRRGQPAHHDSGHIEVIQLDEGRHSVGPEGVGHLRRVLREGAHVVTLGGQDIDGSVALWFVTPPPHPDPAFPGGEESTQDGEFGVVGTFGQLEGHLCRLRGAPA